MSFFISPVAKENITKLQYLLQNTLYTYAEIVSSLGAESSNQLNDELSNVGIKSQAGESDSNLNQEENAKPQSKFDDKFISEKVERLGVLNDQIQAHVDLLPDSSITRDELIKRIEIVDQECEKVSNELELLFKKYDNIYNTLKESLNA